LVEQGTFDVAAGVILSHLVAQLLQRISIGAFRRKAGSGDWRSLTAQQGAAAEAKEDAESKISLPNDWKHAQDMFDGLWRYYTAETDPGKMFLPDGVQLLRMILQCMEELLTNLCVRRARGQWGQVEDNRHAATTLFIGLCRSYEKLLHIRKQILDTRRDARLGQHLDTHQPDKLFSLLVNFAESVSQRSQTLMHLLMTLL
jgi:hypothetical protein